MATVIETSMWVDFFRLKTPLAVKHQIRPWILREDAALCEPVVCELLRSAAPRERPLIERHFASMPMLPTPVTLWSEATRLGQDCTDAGLRVGALDLLIATVCLHHAASLVSFDDDFARMARLCRLQARVLVRDDNFG